MGLKKRNLLPQQNAVQQNYMNTLMPVSQFEKYVVEIMPAISKSCMNVSVCLACVVENLKID